MSGLPGKGAETRTGQSFVEDVEGFYHAVVRGALGVARLRVNGNHLVPSWPNLWVSRQSRIFDPDLSGF